MRPMKAPGWGSDSYTTTQRGLTASPVLGVAPRGSRVAAAACSLRGQQ